MSNKCQAQKYYDVELQLNRLNHFGAYEHEGIVKIENGVTYFEDGSKWIDNAGSGTVVKPPSGPKHDFTHAHDSSLVFELFDFEPIRERIIESIQTGQMCCISAVVRELDRRAGQHHWENLEKELEEEATHQKELTDYFRGPR